MNALLIRGIHGYRRVAYPLYRVTGMTNLCGMQPSCSRYAEAALQQHDAKTALWLVAVRLRRCGAEEKNDLVPPPPYRLSEAEKKKAKRMAARLVLMAGAGWWLGRQFNRR